MPFTLVWTASFKRTAKKFLARRRDLMGTFSLILHKLERNPYDLELHLHPLSGRLAGKHAVSLTYSYRIVLRLEIAENEIILHDVGSHDEVYR